MNQTRRQFVRTLFVAAQAAAFSPLLAPRNLLAADAKNGGLNFVLVGDWGRNGEKDQTAVATQMGIAAEASGAKFVVSVGDNFYENGIATVDDPQWESSYEKVYTAPALQVRWQSILGNHDYHGNCDAQIAYSKTSKRWTMPARYYQRSEQIDDRTAADFFYIDTTPMAQLTDDFKVSHAEVKSQDVPAQVAWLAAALKASTAPWKIVIGHHPVYSGGEHGDTPYIIEHILPLLEQYQVQAYFNGHDHDLQHLVAGKVNLFCTGGGSRPRVGLKQTDHTKFGLGCSGFIAAALQTDKLEVRMINDQGQVLYRTTVPRTAS